MSTTEETPGTGPQTAGAEQEPVQYDEGFGPEVGVGPHPEPWPEGERYDPELLAGGDRRNVVDRYRYWTREAVVADLDTRRHDFHVAVENWGHDFNIGSVVRTANAFLAKEVHIVAGGAGTGAAPWSPTATSTSATTRTPRR